MNEVAYQYAIVRFLPFVETGEFANIGIVMMSAERRYFGFQLIRQRYGRITKFFPELEAKLLLSTIHDLRVEFGRIHDLLKQHGFDRRYKTNDVPFAERLFSDVVGPKEGLIQFSSRRVVAAADNRNTLARLFEFYVERNFVAKNYPEVLLEHDVRKWLSEARLSERFLKMSIGDDVYQATFPFVEARDRTPIKVIKPLHLNQEESRQILDHGANWSFRVNELRKRHVLPSRVLFAVEAAEGSGPRGVASREVVSMLADAGVTVVSHADKQQILDFAIAA